MNRSDFIGLRADHPESAQGIGEIDRATALDAGERARRVGCGVGDVGGGMIVRAKGDRHEARDD